MNDLETLRPLSDNPTPAQLMQLALARDSAIDVIERVASLMEKERDYQARLTFDEALSRCQAAVGRIRPDKPRENGIVWATYPSLDRVLRPIYTAEGFSLSFTQEPAEQGRVRVVARLCRGGVMKEYMRDLPADPPNAKMSRIDAEAAVDSRAKRYLVLSIFNVAVGIDADEQKPFNQGPGIEESKLLDMISAIEGCGDMEELRRVYFNAREGAEDVADKSAVAALADAKNKWMWKHPEQVKAYKGGSK